MKRVVKLNKKADILIKYFVDSHLIRKIARNSRFSRNTIRKYVREHNEKLKELDKAKDRDDLNLDRIFSLSPPV